MSAPPPPEPGAAEPTTLGITKGQRATIADIQAALVVERRRHVTTKETIDAILEFWKEYHRDDRDK
jgi:hypothetical protein